MSLEDGPDEHTVLLISVLFVPSDGFSYNMKWHQCQLRLSIHDSEETIGKS